MVKFAVLKDSCRKYNWYHFMPNIFEVNIIIPRNGLSPHIIVSKDEYYCGLVYFQKENVELFDSRNQALAHLLI
jgi:glycosylphosphatidylinositol transamidase (GPIT) subunit GPI8